MQRPIDHDSKRKFVANLDIITTKTSKGYVLPFSWINAGGMVIADASLMGSQRPSEMDEVPAEYFRNYIAASGWEIDTL